MRIKHLLWAVLIAGVVLAVVRSKSGQALVLIAIAAVIWVNLSRNGIRVAQRMIVLSRKISGIAGDALHFGVVIALFCYSIASFALSVFAAVWLADALTGGLR